MAGTIKGVFKRSIDRRPKPGKILQLLLGTRLYVQVHYCMTTLHASC